MKDEQLDQKKMKRSKLDEKAVTLLNDFWLLG